jgi:hypothetical protein
MADPESGTTAPVAGEEEGFKMPTTFNEFSDLMCKYLSPVEELSPFKLGQIQILIKDINAEAGEAVAPYFAVGMVFFLMLFVAYIVLAIVSIAVDFDAMDCPCAEDSWVWLYVLLAVVIPTSLGFVMGMVKTGLALADLKKNAGFEIPPMFLSLPGPILYIVLGVMGIVLWASMTEECDTFYTAEHSLLIVMFHIQVILLSIASVFGLITCFAQFSVFITPFISGNGKTADEPPAKSE